MRVEYSLELEDGSGDLTFEWDSDKAAANLVKHGIRFEEAVTIFQDEVLTVEDDTAFGEFRELSFGRLQGDLSSAIIICVTHTDRGKRVRIISARKATPHERKQFDVHYRKTYH